MPVKRKEIKTIDSLQKALASLVDGEFESSTHAEKLITHTVFDHSYRTKSENFGGFFQWSLPRSHGGAIVIYKTARTPQKVYEHVCVALRREIEERARKRQLTQRSAAVLDPPPLKRLEHQP